ncbi:hypothetical protein PINS_up022915 [Pythium insidiosum]|nr:hypothetical protein PINS_up022915 [Pythium insidiosum]
MADLGYGGRVLAGEDSEEDEEEDEPAFLSVGFGSMASMARAASQPKFSIATAPVVVTTSAGEAEESEDDEDGDGIADSVVEVSASSALDVDDDEATAAELTEPRKDSAPTPPRAAVEPVRANGTNPHWTVVDGMDGSAIMAHAVVSKLQPSLDATIRRIAELTDSQQRLLSQLVTQNKAVCDNAEIENIAIVMNKLPQYIRKVQDIKNAMSEITTSVDRMKKRAESLRVDAQSHAIKKESKRASLSQWNKLSATKSYETGGNSSSGGGSGSEYPSIS